jgi:hypothetical protein
MQQGMLPLLSDKAIRPGEHRAPQLARIIWVLHLHWQAPQRLYRIHTCILYQVARPISN